MTGVVEIDGSYGEGGGQILRTSLSLSCLTGSPLHIYNIRRGRRKPGLMPQHLTVVRALEAVSSAETEGAGRGSTELYFTPGKVNPGAYTFDIGTAGSTTLLLQALIPPLLFQGEGSRVVLSGGTHVPYSPCFNYIAGVLLPFLKRIGISVRAGIEGYGFYPEGGGRIWAEIDPASETKAVVIREQGRPLSIRGVSAVSNLPLGIGERQERSVVETLGDLPVEIETVAVPSRGRGTFVFLRLETEKTLAGFSALGERGKRAEEVGREAATALLDFLRSGAAIDPHLADQLVLYLALSGEESFFTTSRITGHLTTNLHVVKVFTGVDYEVEGPAGGPGTVHIRPKGHAPLPRDEGNVV